MRVLDYYVMHLHKFQGDPDFLNLQLPVHHFIVCLYGIGGLKCVINRHGTGSQGRFKPDPRLHTFDQEIRKSNIVVVE